MFQVGANRIRSREALRGGRETVVDGRGLEGEFWEESQPRRVAERAGERVERRLGAG